MRFDFRNETVQHVDRKSFLGSSGEFSASPGQAQPPTVRKAGPDVISPNSCNSCARLTRSQGGAFLWFRDN
jgi:hypothetical protein